MHRLKRHPKAGHLQRFSPPVLALLAMLLAVAPATADEVSVQPFLHIEVPASYHMGDVAGFDGFHNAPETLDILLAANFYHGGVQLTMSPLEHENTNATIGPENIYVRQLHTNLFVPMAHPVAVTESMAPGVFNLALEFRLQRSINFAPGTYSGTLTITVSAP